jgi:hypothetical protein
MIESRSEALDFGVRSVYQTAEQLALDAEREGYDLGRAAKSPKLVSRQSRVGV